ncbi:MAG: hypothetical protein M0R46_18080 [Candidatus Muirbacterium halophilum]|nr:hypothetical protein [Candidatus Muirbacterium halophilum]
MNKEIIEFTDGIGRKVVKVIIRTKYGKFSGMAKCSPEDRYDFDYGCRLAYDRAKIKSLKNHAKFLRREMDIFERYQDELIEKYSKIMRNIRKLEY